MLSALIGAGASLLGLNAAKNAQKDQMAMAEKNIALQKEFAQSGIQWRAADAEKAGISKLYALGANTTSYSPVSVGASQVPNAINTAGQHLSRAVAATDTGTGRASQVMQALTTENAALNNELLRSQIRRLDSQVGPPMPQPGTNYLIDGQGDTTIPNIKINPMERSATDPRNIHAEPGAIADVGWSRTATGWAPIPSKDVKNRIEDMIIPEIAWGVRNMGNPSVGNLQPPFPAPEGHKWSYHFGAQEYRLNREPGTRPWGPVPPGYHHW